MGTATNAYLLESALNLATSHTFFGRAEWVEENELFLPDTPLAHETFKVGKLSTGYVYDFLTDSHFKVGIGGLASAYSLPAELSSTYGHPTSYMLFVRIKLQ